MARLTQEKHEEYLRQIMGMYSNPDDAAPMVEALRNDFVESIGTDVVPKSEYDMLKQKYVDRFFGGNAASETVTDNQRADIKNDGNENLTYAALFKDSEGYNGKDE